MYDNRALIERAILAAVGAGAKIMEVYNSEIEVSIKEDQSPLTQADMKANAFINEMLSLTNIPIISEENKQIDYEVRSQWPSCWIVDPLDGTKEFIKHNGEFTVNIALVENGIPKLGIIYVPDEKALYVGHVDHNYAFKAEQVTDADSIHQIVDKSSVIKPKTNPGKNLQVVGSRSHMNDDTRMFIDMLTDQGNEIEIVSRGSSLKFCLIAEGKADVYPRFAPTMEWDTAAGQAICNAVGVEVINRETNKALSYNKENLLNPHFMVARAELKTQLLP